MAGSRVPSRVVAGTPAAPPPLRPRRKPQNTLNDLEGRELTGEAESAMISVEIYGILGNQMLKTDIPWEKLHTFDLSGSQPGIYFIRVLHGKEMGMAKIIRQ